MILYEIFQEFPSNVMVIGCYGFGHGLPISFPDCWKTQRAEKNGRLNPAGRRVGRGSRVRFPDIHLCTAGTVLADGRVVARIPADDLEETPSTNGETQPKKVGDTSRLAKV